MYIYEIYYALSLSTKILHDLRCITEFRKYCCSCLCAFTVNEIQARIY